MSGKTQDWEHRYVAPRSKSLESSLQPRPDQDSVEVYPKSSSTQAQLLNQAVIVLVSPARWPDQLHSAKLLSHSCGGSGGASKSHTVCPLTSGIVDTSHSLGQR